MCSNGTNQCDKFRQYMYLYKIIFLEWGLESQRYIALPFLGKIQPQLRSHGYSIAQSPEVNKITTSILRFPRNDSSLCCETALFDHKISHQSILWIGLWQKGGTVDKTRGSMESNLTGDLIVNSSLGRSWSVVTPQAYNFISKRLSLP